MKNFITSMLYPPLRDDKEENRISSFLRIIIATIVLIAILVGVTDALAGVPATGIAVAIGIIPLITAYYLTHHSHITIASYLTIFTLIATTTGLISIGQGIHDIGVLYFALILIIASYILPLNGMIPVTLIIISSIAFIVWGEIFQILPLKITPDYFAARPADFIIVSLSLIIGAVAISIMSNTMLTAIKTATDSEARWRSLVDNAPDLILGITPDGTISFFNNAAAQNPVNLKLGSNVFDLLPEDIRERARAVIGKVIQSASMMREVPISLPGDKVNWYSLRIGPIFRADGQVTGAMIIATDIQHKKDFETELSESREVLRKQTEQLTMLYDISKTVTSLRDLDNALKLILSQVDAIIPMDAFIVMFYDREKDEISYPLLYDSGQIWQEKPRKLSSGGWVTKAIKNRKAFILHRTPQDMETMSDGLPIGKTSNLSASLMVAPLIVGQDVIGAISTHSYTYEAYNTEYLSLLSGAANQIAIAVENSRLYDALQKELTERKRAEAEVRQLNLELENRVHQRTAELEEANNELASFTYTVSHDLRAPLRGIHGLSHMFMDEYGENLPSTSKAYIQRIQSNARQMGQLIDDLLNFTHLGRKSINRTNVDMNEVVQLVFYHLKDKKKNIILNITPMPQVFCDRALLLEVMTNLLSNAIKFTSIREEAVIEVGSGRLANETYFYVRDNGAGFDMNYSAKLFGVFQRLHRQDEFEGTGVGLAIVKRIIQRHGGKVWAEGIPEIGATFYFTLPEKEGK